MRSGLLILAVLAASCRDSSLLGAQGDLRVEPQHLDFPSAWEGQPATAAVTVTNAGRGRLEVTLTATAPFQVAPTLSLAGGADETVTVTLPASSAGDFEGVLSVSAGEKKFDVTLNAHVAEHPVCEASECHVSTFDPVRGECVEAPGNEDAPCGAHNACIIGAVCRNGTCMGTPRDCDDGDACTSDSCARAAGCRHDAITCAEPANPCLAALCDPSTGCGSTPVEDGVLCGDNDCSTAHVCIDGACVTRPSPEGSQCAPASGCIGPSACVNSICTPPPPSIQTPAWRYGPIPEHELVFRGHVDNDGNAYLVESYFQDDTQEIDTLVTELVSFAPNGLERFREVVATGCNGCRYGIEFALDTTGGRLFYVLRDELVARSLTDGHVLWHVPYADGVPVYDGRPDGGGAYSPSAPMLVGTNAVAVPVMEGLSDHHSYVRVFDRATGQLRWQFHRKGHLYGPGVTGDGELWTSSANCWAPAGEVSRVASTGVELGSHFYTWMPQAYGDDEAFGYDTNTGTVNRVDDGLLMHDLSPMVGNQHIYGTPLVLDSIIVFKEPDGTVRSFDLTTGQNFALTDPRPMSGIQLLRSGGVGWAGSTATGGYVRAVDPHGAQIYECPLSVPVDGPFSIVGGRVYANSGSNLVVFTTPGLDASPRGWSGERGSPERSGRAR